MSVWDLNCTLRGVESSVGGQTKSGPTSVGTSVEMDYRCHDRVGGNELNAKHRNQKHAANGRTYHTEEKVCHQSSSLVAERGYTTEHESNYHNDNENLSLKAHLGVVLICG